MAIAIAREGLGARHPELANHFSNRGEILRLLGRYSDARPAFERARTIWERELGADNVLLAYALTGIGETLIAEGNPNGALVPLERALKIRLAQDADLARQAETKFALARALRDSNRDRARARVLAEEAKAAYAKTASDKVDEVARWLGRFEQDTPRPRLARR
jgi:tetratricopeptide (TPR) repeat protein